MRYFIADCDGFDEHGDAYCLFTTEHEDYPQHSVEVEPCFLGPQLPPVSGPELPPDWFRGLTF